MMSAKNSKTSDKNVKYAMNIYDTSSVVEASENGIPMNSGYTIPLIWDEMQNFSDGNGRNGAHIKSEYMGKVSKNLPPASYADGSALNEIRENVLFANARANQGKKTDNDPISLGDIALITGAVSMAMNKVPVNVFSEDAHVSNTLNELFQTPGYSSLKHFISVTSYRSKLQSK